MGGFPASHSVQFNKPRGSSTEEALHSLQTRCYVRGFVNTSPREPQAALRGRCHHCPHYRGVDAESQKVKALAKGHGTRRRERKRCQASRRLRGRSEKGQGAPGGPGSSPEVTPQPQKASDAAAAHSACRAATGRPCHQEGVGRARAQQGQMARQRYLTVKRISVRLARKRNSTPLS